MRPFKLEEYFVAHEFSAQYLLCCSDAESWSMAEILAMSPEKEPWENLRLGYRGLKPNGTKTHAKEFSILYIS